MFGGLTFMIRGKICVSVGRDRTMCRIDPAVHESALATVVMKGREFRGFRLCECGRAEIAKRARLLDRSGSGLQRQDEKAPVASREAVVWREWQRFWRS